MQHYYTQCYMFYSVVVLSNTMIHRVVKALFTDVQWKACAPMGALQHHPSQTQLWVRHLS